MKLPVMSNREIIGHASTIEGARRLIKRTVQVSKLGELIVWRRTELSQELNHLPDAYVWGIAYGQRVKS